MYLGDLFFLLLIYLICSFSFHAYQNCRRKCIFEKVKWIVDRSPHKFVRYIINENLLYYIRENVAYTVKKIKVNKIKFTIPEEYRINYSNKQETSYVSEILEMYTKHEIECFFNETKESLSKKEKQLYKMRNETYFMYTFFCFLRDCTNIDSQTFGDKIYECKSSITPQHCYNLTEFGRVCYKLYLITFMSCVNSDNAKSLITESQLDYIMKCLEKNEVCFEKYRP